MPPKASFRRLLIVLVLLPQVLLLGLGHGVVICLKGGDPQVAVARRSCCAGAFDPGAGGAAGHTAVGSPELCDCCLELPVDPASTATRAHDRTEHESQAPAVPALLGEVPPFERSCSPRRRPSASRDRQPPRSLHLRSVVLRC